MSWNELVRELRLDNLLVPNMRKAFETAAWFEIPGLLLLCVVCAPLIALLTAVGWLPALGRLLDRLEDKLMDKLEKSKPGGH